MPPGSFNPYGVVSVEQQAHHGNIYNNQGPALIDNGVGVGVNVSGAPVQQPWYAPVEPPQTHPLSLDDQNAVYGPDDTWSEYNNLLKNYSMHGGLG